MPTTVTSAATHRRSRVRTAAVSAPAALGALVFVSAALRLWLARDWAVPWIAPDEMLYGLLGETFWSDGRLDLRSLPAPYYSTLTPLVVGLPLALADQESAMLLAQALQSLCMALVAVPVFLWARRLAEPRLAYAAAVLAVLPPGLGYGSLLMSEPLSYLAVTCALYAAARAIEEPTLFRFGAVLGLITVAAAVRLQALLLVPVVVLAAILDAVAARSTTRARSLAPLGLIGLGVVLAGLAAEALGLWSPSASSFLGAYAPVTDRSTGLAGTLDDIAWHAFGIHVLVLGVPVLALGALVAEVARRRAASPSLRAYVAVSCTYVVALAVQVGLFAADHVGHVSERYLLTAAPVIVVGLVAWLDRGAPRRPGITLPLAGLAALAAALIPLSALAASDVLVDSLTPAPLQTLLGHPPWGRVALVAFVLAAAAVALVPPRERIVPIVLCTLAVAFAVISLDAAGRVRDASIREQRVTAGLERRSWVDRALDRGDRAVLVEIGDRPWTSVARTFFWNETIEQVAVLDRVELPFLPDAPRITLAADGRLLDLRGEAITVDYAVVPSSFRLDGTLIAEHAPRESEVAPLGLWHTSGPLWVTQRVEGLQPNGDLVAPVRVTVYRCGPGALELDLLGKSGAPITVSVDGLGAGDVTVPGGTMRTARVPAPGYADGSGTCTFDLAPRALQGSTRIAFVKE